LGRYEPDVLHRWGVDMVDERLKTIRESIERRVTEWHNSDAPLSLCEFLGWTPSEYEEWLQLSVIPAREFR
jgi:hypothetical protein